MEGKSNTFNIIIIGILMFIIGGLIGYYCFNCNSKNTSADCGSETTEQKEEQKQEVEEPISYVGYYTTYENPASSLDCATTTTESTDCISDTDPLQLHNDGTYIFALSTVGVFEPSVGTYTVNNDNTITLKEAVRYGSDACFYKNNLNTYTIKIVDKNTLNLTVDNKVYTFSRDLSNKDTISNQNYYVLNPIDGKAPEGGGEVWVDCSNLTRK